MSNETMTDARALGLLRDMVYPHAKAGSPNDKAFQHIAARLRGEAAPEGQAVAYHIQHPDGLVALRKRESVDEHMVEQAAADGIVIRPLVFAAPAALNEPYGNSEKLPAPVAGDAAIREVIHELRNYNPPADPYNGEYIHPGWATRLEAALARQPAAVDEAMVERAVEGYEDGPWVAFSPEASRETHRDRIRCALTAALAQDRASQAGVPVGVGVTEASIFCAADALCGEWNLHYPDAVRMAKTALTAALRTGGGAS